MGKCPQPVIDSNETIDLVDNAKKIGFSFRTIPVEDKRVTSEDYRLMSVEDKPKTSTVPMPVENKSKKYTATPIGFKPEVVTISTKKPVKL